MLLLLLYSREIIIINYDSSANGFIFDMCVLPRPIKRPSHPVVNAYITWNWMAFFWKYTREARNQKSYANTIPLYVLGYSRIELVTVTIFSFLLFLLLQLLLLAARSPVRISDAVKNPTGMAARTRPEIWGFRRSFL